MEHVIRVTARLVGKREARGKQIPVFHQVEEGRCCSIFWEVCPDNGDRLVKSPAAKNGICEGFGY